MQQTEFDAVMSVNSSTNNDPMRQERIANITCYKCRQKCHYGKGCPNSAGTIPQPNKNIQMQSYNPQANVPQTMTASYAVPQSSIIIIRGSKCKTNQLTTEKECAASQMNQGSTTQSVMFTKPIKMPMASTTKTISVGNETVNFVTKPTNESTNKTTTGA